MDLWFSEAQTDDMRISIRVKEILYHERSPYQEILLVDTYEFGRLLALDDIVQTNERTEFVYHEMMAHVPLFAHPNPERVLVVGGGDGGVLREVVKHPCVKEAVLAEIDEKVVQAARRFLPSISSGFDDPRARVEIGDGIKYVAEHPNTYDVIIVDSTDPVGHAEGLFSTAFYRSAFQALRDGGIFVEQTESPFYTANLVRRVQKSLREVFPYASLYWSVVPEYPGGFWTMSIGTKGIDPTDVPPERYEERGFKGFATKYYSPDIHRAAFVCPPFLAELMSADDDGAAAGGGGE